MRTSSGCHGLRWFPSSSRLSAMIILDEGDKHGSSRELGVVIFLLKEKEIYIWGIYVAGPPGFEPGISGSEGPGYINQASRENHKPETVCNDDYQITYPFG